MKLPEKERLRLIAEWEKAKAKVGLLGVEDELLPHHLQWNQWLKKQKRQIETPEEFEALKRECAAVVKHYIDKAREKCGINLPYPPIRFDIKGTTAGQAVINLRDISKTYLRFSPVLLRENANHFLEQTTGHEVAHYVSYAKHGRIDPHGVEWQRIMWAFSLPANRCHNYDVSNVSTQLGKRKNAKSLHTVKTEQGIVKFAAGAKIIEFD